MILGIDEVGRGAWAGPLLVGACVWPDGVQLKHLTDSKKLSKKQREKLEPELKRLALAFALGRVEAREIDQIGLAKSLHLASVRAVEQINPKLYDRIIIDGTVDFLDSPLVTVMKQADLLVPAVSAAANLAKLTRDRLMAEFDNLPHYARYQFTKHVGYGTKLHRAMLEKYGPSDQHRLSFKPVAQIAHKYQLAPANLTGQKGEFLASTWFQQQGFEIIARNWRTKWFEIDLVVKRGNMLGLIEVKTRSSQAFGGAWASIDRRKIWHLRRAADLILQQAAYQDCRLQIGILSVQQAATNCYVDELLWLEF